MKDVAKNRVYIVRLIDKGTQNLSNQITQQETILSGYRLTKSPMILFSQLKPKGKKKTAK